MACFPAGAAAERCGAGRTVPAGRRHSASAAAIRVYRCKRLSACTNQHHFVVIVCGTPESIYGNYNLIILHVPDAVLFAVYVETTPRTGWCALGGRSKEGGAEQGRKRAGGDTTQIHTTGTAVSTTRVGCAEHSLRSVLKEPRL